MVEVYVFHAAVPADACEPLSVIVAADRATHAAQILRQAGVRHVRWKDARPNRDADGRAVALAEPGVIFWSRWEEEPPVWHRTPPGSSVESSIEAEHRG
jgi:hypothetical protein